MALAEARAAWQRTANRCLVQEDAKRAPKLACCSSMPPPTKPVEITPTNSDIGQDIPSTPSWPLNPPSSDSNLSPNSKWWLQLQPNYSYQKYLIEEPVSVNETETSACEKKDKEDEFKSFYDQKAKFEETIDAEVLVGCKVSEDENEKLSFDSEKSNTPWWRTADTEELAFLVSQSSLDVTENCDLPRPAENTRSRNNIFPDHGYKQGRLLAVGSDSPKFRMFGEGPLISEADKISRNYSHSEEMMHNIDEDTTKTQLLEALRHSQSRAREAETAAKQAYVEKEHVLKLVFKQASQLFAYKQWLQLLQLENMYYQIKTNKTTVFPVVLPWTPQRTKKTRKSWQKSYYSRRRPKSKPKPKHSFLDYDVGKYAVILAFGLGLVGAGVLLGWTIGWMLPTL